MSSFKHKFFNKKFIKFDKNILIDKNAKNPIKKALQTLETTKWIKFEYIEC